MEVGGRHNTMVEEQDLGHPGVDAALGFMDACRSGTGGLEVQEVSRNGVIRCWPSQDMARPLRNTTPTGPSVASERVCRCGPQPGTGPRTLDGVLRILSHAEGSRGQDYVLVPSGSAVARPRTARLQRAVPDIGGTCHVQAATWDSSAFRVPGHNRFVHELLTLCRVLCRVPPKGFWR